MINLIQTKNNKNLNDYYNFRIVIKQHALQLSNRKPAANLFFLSLLTSLSDAEQLGQQNWFTLKFGEKFLFALSLLALSRSFLVRVRTK